MRYHDIDWRAAFDGRSLRDLIDLQSTLYSVIEATRKREMRRSFYKK